MSQLVKDCLRLCVSVQQVTHLDLVYEQNIVMILMINGVDAMIPTSLASHTCSGLQNFFVTSQLNLKIHY